MKAKESGVGMPAPRIAAFASTLSIERAQDGGVGAGEGDAEQLEQLLHGPVLAADAVHGDEGDLGPLGAQAFHEVGADVDRDDLVAEPFERVLDPGAGAERDAALERAPAFEDRDAHQLPPAWRNGITTESASEESGCDGRGFRRGRPSGTSSASRPGVPGEP